MIIQRKILHPPMGGILSTVVAHLMVGATLSMAPAVGGLLLAEVAQLMVVAVLMVDAILSMAPVVGAILSTAPAPVA